jgi:hypothetical protein
MGKRIVEQIWLEFRNIGYRLDDIEKALAHRNDVAPTKIPEYKVLELPDHLRKTFLAVKSSKECTAASASIRTKRNRAVECAYMNQLVQMGWLKRRRLQREVYFSCSVR